VFLSAQWRIQGFFRFKGEPGGYLTAFSDEVVTLLSEDLLAGVAFSSFLVKRCGFKPAVTPFSFFSPLCGPAFYMAAQAASLRHCLEE